MEDAGIIKQLWDERMVKSVILKFGRALDTGIWSNYRACFLDEINIDFQRLTGSPEIRISADLWTRFADMFLSRVRRHHLYSNFDITVDGDCARATVYMIARHWKSTDRGASYNNQYGWYDFSLERRSQGWFISRVKHDFQWVDGNEALLAVHEPELMEMMGRIFCEDNFVEHGTL